MTNWITPAQAMQMVFDNPGGAAEDYGFALLRRAAKGQSNTVSDLVRAKLQPREPTMQEVSGERLPVTAAAWQLVLAPGVPDVAEVGDFLSGYDAATPAKLKLLAVVITAHFPHDTMTHDIMSAASTYADIILARQRRLTSLVVCHRPADSLSTRAPHAHIIALARVHRPSGFGEQHRSFQGDSAKIHKAYLEEWRSFHAAWDRVPDS